MISCNELSITLSTLWCNSQLVERNTQVVEHVEYRIRSYGTVSRRVDYAVLELCCSSSRNAICGTVSRPVEYAIVELCCSSTKITRSSWSVGQVEIVRPGTKHSTELMIAKWRKSTSVKGERGVNNMYLASRDFRKNG